MITLENGKYISRTSEGAFEIGRDTVHYSTPKLFIDLLRSTTSENVFANYQTAKNLYEITKGIYKAEGVTIEKANEILPKVIFEIAKQECEPLIAEFALKYVMREYAYWVIKEKNMECAQTVFAFLTGPITALRFNDTRDYELYYRAVRAFYDAFGKLYYYQTTLRAFEDCGNNQLAIESVDDKIKKALREKNFSDTTFGRPKKWTLTAIELLDAPAQIVQSILSINKNTNELSEDSVNYYNAVTQINNEIKTHFTTIYGYNPDTGLDRDYKAFKNGNYLSQVYKLSKKMKYYSGMLYVSERIQSNKRRDDVAYEFGYTDLPSLGADELRIKAKIKKFSIAIIIALAVGGIGWYFIKWLGFLGMWLVFFGIVGALNPKDFDEAWKEASKDIDFYIEHTGGPWYGPGYNAYYGRGYYNNIRNNSW